MGKRWMPEAYVAEYMKASVFSKAEKDRFIAPLDKEVSDDDRLYILCIIRSYYEARDKFEEYEELIDRQGDFHGRTIVEGLLARERFEKRSTRALLMNHGLHLPYALSLEVEQALEWASKPDREPLGDLDDLSGLKEDELTEIARRMAETPFLYSPGLPIREISDGELMNVLARESIDRQVLYLNSLDLRERGDEFVDFVVRRYIAGVDISEQSLLVLQHLLFALTYTEYAGAIELHRIHSGLRHRFESVEELTEMLFGAMMQREDVEERLEDEIEEAIEEGDYGEDEAEELALEIMMLYDWLDSYLFPESIDLSSERVIDFAEVMQGVMSLDDVSKQKFRKEEPGVAFFEKGLAAVFEEFQLLAHPVEEE